MAIEPALLPGSIPFSEEIEPEDELEISIEGEEVIEELIDEEAMNAALAASMHDANLADHMSDDALASLSKDLTKSIEDDKTSRKEWEQILEKGLELLGTKYQENTDLFEGASGVVHPILAKAVVQFQAQAYVELCPANGPVKTRVAGDALPEIVQQANRVEKFMNYEITEDMEEFEEEFDNLLFRLPLDGSAFKKTYFDEILQRPVSKFVAAKDIVIPYTAGDIGTVQRFVHVVPISKNDMNQMIATGFYRDIDLGEPSQERQSQLEEREKDVEGIEVSKDRDEYTILEVHVTTELEGFEEESQGVGVPYIITIEEDTEKILAIRRNWDEGDERKKRKNYFSHYKFLPGTGFYGFGLTHMIGNLSITSTAILRMLIDAGTFANLPGGFKAKGMRIRGDNDPVKPGEFRDVDVPGGNLREQIIPLPFKEPSSTLLALLGSIIDAGKEFAATTNEKLADSNQQAPVGTTVALMEQGMKVMSGVHKRLHRAQKNEFRILSRIIKENYVEYPYEVSGKRSDVLAEDFDARVDILPVSDPNVFSMTQRISMAQVQLQMVASNPGLHGQKGQYEAFRRMYSALGVPDIEAILPLPKEPAPKDPATEASEALTGEAMQAFVGQDHALHVDVHVASMSLPSMVNPVVQLAFESHILEHIAFRAKEEADAELQEITDAIPSMPPELQERAVHELEMRKAKMIAEKVSVYIDGYLKLRQESGGGEQEDPLVAIRKQELALQTEKLRQEAKRDADKMMFDRERGQAADVLGFKRIGESRHATDSRTQVARERITSNEEQSDERNNTMLESSQIRASGFDRKD